MEIIFGFYGLFDSMQQNSDFPSNHKNRLIIYVIISIETAILSPALVLSHTFETPVDIARKCVNMHELINMLGFLLTLH